MTFSLDPHEAAHASKLNTGDLMIFVRLLKKQPSEGLNFSHIAFDYVYFNNRLPGFITSKAWNIKLLYPVGTKLDGKETWRWFYKKYTKKIQYKADFNKDDLRVFRGIDYSKWYSSVTMPQDAIRSRFEVVEARVDRCDNATLDEAKLIMGGRYGMITWCDLQDYIVSKYGKDAWNQYSEIFTVGKV